VIVEEKEGEENKKKKKYLRAEKEKMGASEGSPAGNFRRWELAQGEGLSGL